MEGHTQIVSLDVPRRTEHHAPSISLECLENQTPPDPRCMKDILRSPPPWMALDALGAPKPAQMFCLDLGGMMQDRPLYVLRTGEGHVRFAPPP